VLAPTSCFRYIVPLNLTTVPTKHTHAHSYFPPLQTASANLTRLTEALERNEQLTRELEVIVQVCLVRLRVATAVSFLSLWRAAEHRIKFGGVQRREFPQPVDERVF
jgi:hypothetical protein